MMKTSNPFGIYIHIPFCKERCTYCDFLTYPHVPSFHAPYVEALIQEIRHPETKRRLDGRRVSSIFLGGGTPSLLPPKALLRIFETLRGEVSLEESCEISIEANPDTITPETAECFALCGINRVSLGVQSFSPRLLEAMGRTHHADDVENAVRSLHKAGICNINFDLIEGYPQQTISDIEHDLAAVERYAPTHISWYSLILEEKTLLHYQWKRGRIEMMDEDSEWRLTEKIRSGIQKLGYHRYEISNYAKTGFQSVHNLLYWTGEDYLGLGLGAASYIKGIRFEQTRRIGTYLAIGEEPLPITILERTEEDALFEQIMTGLRKVSGIQRSHFQKKNGVDPLAIAPRTFAEAREEGLADWNDEALFLTERGLDLQNRVLVAVYEEMEETISEEK